MWTQCTLSQRRRYGALFLLVLAALGHVLLWVPFWKPTPKKKVVVVGALGFWMSIDLAECLRCQSLSGSCQNALNSRGKVQHGNDDDDDDGDDDNDDDNEEFWQSL